MTLVIEHLPDRVVERLREKAQLSGRTVSEEAAAVLTEAIASREPPAHLDDLQRIVWEMFGGRLPKNGVEEFLAERRAEAAKEDARL
jgi:hypothetical protein